MIGESFIRYWDTGTHAAGKACLASRVIGSYGQTAYSYTAHVSGLSGQEGALEGTGEKAVTCHQNFHIITKAG